MTRPSTDAPRLADALGTLRTELAHARFPLAVPAASHARRRAHGIVEQLDDYLIPRLGRLDAPLLAVVGGSTGAGKSTLINSLVGERVSASGILRPTTRGPVLVCHPADAAWFNEKRILPNLPRALPSSESAGTLRVAQSAALAPGLAVLDAPDIDSVVEENRALAEQLLAAADLWLFVTTAARYADAVPWDFLETARKRGTAIALVLDRVPPGGGPTVCAHLGSMLDAQGLGGTELFVVEEQPDTPDMLPADAVQPLATWLAQLASDASARADVVRQTVDGAVAALDPAVAELAQAADEQAAALVGLRSAVDSSYLDASAQVAHAVTDGSLLRGEVLARWQQLVGTGEFMRGLQARVSRTRDRLVARAKGRPTARQTVESALESGLAAVVASAVGDAADHVAGAWHLDPAGRALLRAHPHLQHADQAVLASVDRGIREWQRDVLALVQASAGDKVVAARIGAYTVNALGLAVMIAVFTATAFIPTGAEVAVAGGTTVAGQKVLEAIFGDQAVRRLAAQARGLLLGRVEALLDDDASRYRGALAAQRVSPSCGESLRHAAAAVREARHGFSA